jgi:hypothetical protein
MKNLNEKTEIKRKYGEYAAIHVLESAPVRNSVVEFVGKRFITEDELKNYVNSIKELNTNGSNNQSRWLKNNTRYFESVENRGQRVIKLSKFGERILEKIVKAKAQMQSNSVNEGRSQVKRKYGEYSNIRINEKAPIRNKIINFVGKKFVTEAELESQLTKITEEIGKEFNRTKWFKNNQRYFESFENRGQKVWTLSKYGKRVHEFINKKPENKLMENQTIGIFKSSLFESTNKVIETEFELEINEWINEGTLAKKGAKDLDDMNMQDMIDDNSDMAGEFKELCDKLGEKPVDVIQVDSETCEDDPLMNKIYKYLESNFRGTETITKGGPGSFTQYDPKLNVVRADDYGFVAFYFTAKSNF